MVDIYLVVGYILADNHPYSSLQKSVKAFEGNFFCLNF